MPAAEGRVPLLAREAPHRVAHDARAVAAPRRPRDGVHRQAAAFLFGVVGHRRRRSGSVRREAMAGVGMGGDGGGGDPAPGGPAEKMGDEGVATAGDADNPRHSPFSPRMSMAGAVESLRNDDPRQPALWGEQQMGSLLFSCGDMDGQYW